MDIIVDVCKRRPMGDGPILRNCRKPTVKSARGLFLSKNCNRPDQSHNFYFLISIQQISASKMSVIRHLYCARIISYSIY